MNLEEYRAHLKTVRTEAGEFAYLDVGEGPPAVFLHGVFINGYLWRDVIDQLKDERRCIAYNLPCHGGSKVSPSQDLSLPAQREMFKGFLDALELADIDIVANDTGGAVAQAFAAKNPDRVRSLVLTNCEARDVLPSSADLAQLVLQLAKKKELAPVMIQQLQDFDIARGEVGLGAAFDDPQQLTDEDIHGYLEPQQASLEAAREVERTIASLKSEDLVAIQPELEKLDVPTLCVWGTGDKIFELELAHWLREHVPGCQEVVEVEGGELFWPGERPDELVPPVRRHWAATERERRAATA